MEHELKKWLRKRLTAKRYMHSLAVKKRAVILAGLHGENEEKAALAGLLHDCCKCMPADEQLKIIRARGIIIPAENGQPDQYRSSGPVLDDFMLAQPQLWHGPAASIVVEEELHIRDADVLSAIRLHSTGSKNMTRFEQVIYLADLTSEDRKYPDAHKVRGMSDKSLEKSMLYCLRYIMGALIDKGAPVVRDTWEAYNYFWGLNK